MNHARSGGWVAALAPVRLTGRPTASLAATGATSFVGLVAQGLIRLGVSIVIGRLAGERELGIVAAGMATAQFLILLWPTTSGQAASRFLARARGRGADAELLAAARHLARGVIGATGLLACAAVVITLARGLDWRDGLYVAMFLAGVAGQQFTRGIHYGVGAVRRVVVLDIVFSVLGLAGVTLALAGGVRGTVLLLPLAVAYLLLALACWPWGARAQADAPLRREIDRFVAFGSLGTIASAGLVQLSVLVADRIGANAAGTYAAASNLAIPLTLVSGAMSLVVYPSMSEAFGRGDSNAVRTQLDRGVRGLILLMVPVVGVCSLLARDIVSVVYGPAFGASTPVLAILLLAVLCSMVGVPCVNALTSGGQRGIEAMAGVSLLGLASAALAWALLVPRIGVTGVAVGYLIGVATTAGVALTACWLRWRPRWASPLAGMVVAVAAVAVAVAWAWEQPAPLRVSVAVVGALAWFAVQPRATRSLLSVLCLRRHIRSGRQISSNTHSEGRRADQAS